MDPFSINPNMPGMPMIPGVNDWPTMGGGGMSMPSTMGGSQKAGQGLLDIFRGPAPPAFGGPAAPPSPYGSLAPRPQAPGPDQADMLSALRDSQDPYGGNAPQPPQRPDFSALTSPAGGLGSAPMPPPEFGGSQGSSAPQWVQDDGSNNAYWLNEAARQGGTPRPAEPIVGGRAPPTTMGTDADSSVGQGAMNFFDRLKKNADTAGFKFIDDNSILGKLGNMGGPVQQGDGILPIFLKSLMNY